MSYRVTLMHPPLDDPTVPYHAGAYLVGHLRQNGFEEVGTRDINIEYVNHCLEAENIQAFYAEADRRLGLLGRSPRFSYQEQEQYYRLTAAPRYTPAELHRDLKLFRTRAEFLEYPDYVRAMRRMNGYFGLLGVLSYPGEIENFMLKSRGRFSPYNLADLLSPELGETLCYPFVRFFEQKLRHDAGLQQTDLFGISIVYDHQLIHAFQLARMLKRQWPEKRIVLGGTAISQLYKYLKDKQKIKLFFKFCDAIVIGEGETAICQIAAMRGEFSSPGKLTNTITYDRYRDELSIPTLEYEDLTVLGAPAYDLPWDLYLSPERGINYAPTRGCYWNRCTFCDYGLNTDKPTSPWRERRTDQVISDLKAAQEQFGVRYVYMAVDVLAPAYMDRLADAIVQSKLDICWSAEIRLEKVFNPERARKIAKSGAVCLSFGMESGNQRVLDLIDKGTKVAYMGETMKNFAEAGVAVQLMAFTGFPTETAEEANETRQFVRSNEPYWSAGGLGRFLLTGTSIVARKPEKFGIKILETKDADIARVVTYTVGDEEERKGMIAEEADGSFDDSSSEFPNVLGRPWAGGTDSLHSMIYYEAYGRNSFKLHTLDRLLALAPSAEEDLLQCTLAIDGRLARSKIDLTRVFENRQILVDYLKGQLEKPSETTYSSFLEWEHSVATVEAAPEETLWLVTLNSAVRLGKLVYQLLQVAISQQLKLGDLLSGFQPDIRSRLLDHFREMEKQGMLTFVQAGRPQTGSALSRLALSGLAAAVEPRVAPELQVKPSNALIQLMPAGRSSS